ncbi:queuosine precursor transporter [Gordonia sp. PP30]|nr:MULTISPECIES: queuosine precursor transporter [unclassified Gordonia (in: high G+C Gram-positive bacteria)]UQE76962.1 queuosine precursor transporter [Gordonia sp. PP30]
MLMAVFVAIMLISNIAATKGVGLFGGWLVTDGAFFLFPLSYVIGDVISEVYGFKAMRRTIWTGFGILILASVAFTITIALPPLDGYDNQSALESVVGAVPQLVAASLAGYLVGEFTNSWVLVKMKERTGERRLWARLIGSTVAGEFFDTLVFCTIAAPVIGVHGWGQFTSYVAIGFVWKTAVEVVVMPATYAVVRFLKRAEPSYAEALGSSVR